MDREGRPGGLLEEAVVVGAVAGCGGWAALGRSAARSVAVARSVVSRKHRVAVNAAVLVVVRDVVDVATCCQLICL